MKILVKTASTLTRFLPAGAKNNTVDIEVPAGATPADVMQQLGFPEGSYLVILNGSTVPRSERQTLALTENDQLSVMPPLKGG